MLDDKDAPGRKNEEHWLYEPAAAEVHIVAEARR